MHKNKHNKLGILTLHSGYNEGAVLQAFCLAENLRRTFSNSKVEIVDYRYPSKVNAYGPAINDRKKALNEFIADSLPLSEKAFLEDNHQAAFQYIRQNYNAIVMGSDELWKLNYIKRFLGLISEQNDPWCPAFPNVYWPDESIEIPKIAYAASIGQTNWLTIPGNHIKRMRRILSSYSLLGIRDRRTMTFLEWLSPDISSKAEWVPDPTFSNDILSIVDKEELKEKLQKWGVDFGRPRTCIVLENSLNINNKIIQEMKKRKIQIVGLSLSNNIADVLLFDKGLSPLEWFSAFGFMDFCISQRMHACISCILNDTPFIAVDIYSNPMDDDTKVKDLMRSFNLLDYYYNVEKDPPEKFQGIIENLFNKPWPVHDTGQKKNLFTNRSKEFTGKIRDVLSC